MKGISPMIATVLLIGFTVAVGAILAVWFSTFTKTQTASVSKSSSCSTILADVSGLSYNKSTHVLNMLVTNPGDQKITLKSIVIKCGNNNAGIVNNESKLISVDASSQNTTQINLTSEVNPPLSECTESNIGIKITYSCEKGGTNSAECPIGTCFS